MANRAAALTIPTTLCPQVQGKPHLSGCWPDPSNLTKEVRVYYTHQGHTRWHTHADVCSVSGDIPILNVSFKPQTISPKFKVGWAVFVLTLQLEGHQSNDDMCSGYRQSSALRKDQRRLHPPTVHHGRHEAHADREHHWPRSRRL